MKEMITDEMLDRINRLCEHGEVHITFNVQMSQFVGLAFDREKVTRESLTEALCENFFQMVHLWDRESMFDEVFIQDVYTGADA